VSLLTACGHNDDGSTTCFSPRVGFTFDPFSDLKIGSLATQETLSSHFFSQLKTYAAVSTFVAVSYILASLLTVLSCVSVVLLRRFGQASLVSRASSLLAALLLIAATIASIVTFIKTRDAFNAALNGIGVKSATSSGALGLSVVASVLALAAFVLVLFVRLAVAGYARKNHLEEQGLEDFGGAGSKSRRSKPAGANIGLLERVPTWKQGRYTQIQGNKHSRDVSPESDREGLIGHTRGDIDHGKVAGTSGYPQSAWEKRRSR